MPKDKQSIIDDIEEHIERCGGTFGDWYVGISKDARTRLFTEHRVREKKDAWIYRKAASIEIAREVEAYFVGHRQTAGGTGGGDLDSKAAYAYKIAPHTQP